MTKLEPTEAQLDAAMKTFGDTELVGHNYTRRAMRAALTAALRAQSTGHTGGRDE